MKISRENIHKYLGMILEYSELVEVKINMTLYIEDMVKDFGKCDGKMKTSVTPESDQLFKTR